MIFLHSTNSVVTWSIFSMNCYAFSIIGQLGIVLLCLISFLEYSLIFYDSDFPQTENATNSNTPHHLLAAPSGTMISNTIGALSGLYMAVHVDAFTNVVTPSEVAPYPS